MKRIAMAVVAGLMVPSGAYADDAERMDAYDKCEIMGKIATYAMTSRQEGVEITTLLRATKEGDLGDMVREIIMRAYETPEYRTEDNRRDAIGRFGREMNIICIQGMTRD